MGNSPRNSPHNSPRNSPHLSPKVASTPPIYHGTFSEAFRDAHNDLGNSPRNSLHLSPKVASTPPIYHGTFSEAFRDAHNDLGAGKIFRWNPSDFTTDRADGRDLRAEREAFQTNTSPPKSPSPRYTRSPSPKYTRSPSPKYTRSPSPKYTTLPFQDLTTVPLHDIMRAFSSATLNQTSISLSNLSSDAKGESSSFPLTWNAEGTGEKTRKLHYPKGGSGVTIGKGYDLGQRSKSDFEKDFKKIGVENKIIEKLKTAIELKGKKAKNWIKQSDLKDQLLLTSDQEKQLFELTIPYYVEDVKRICNKSDNIKKYGQVDFHHLNPAIWDIVVDLRYRGDYHPNSRQKIQKYLVNNDVLGLLNCCKDKQYWLVQLKIPTDRFHRRIQHLENSIGIKEIN